MGKNALRWSKFWLICDELIIRSVKTCSVLFTLIGLPHPPWFESIYLFICLSVRFVGDESHLNNLNNAKVRKIWTNKIILILSCCSWKSQMQSMGLSLDQVIDAYWVDVEALKMLEDTSASRIQHSGWSDALLFPYLTVMQRNSHGITAPLYDGCVPGPNTE